MTRRPPLDAQAVAVDQLPGKVSRGCGSKGPQSRPGFWWLLLAAGLLFFLGHATSMDSQLPKGIDRCAARHVPGCRPACCMRARSGRRARALATADTTGQGRRSLLPLGRHNPGSLRMRPQ
jgi:hypothetical protein